MTAEQVRAVDRWAIETLGVCGLVLMENAGRSAADLAALMACEAEGPRVAVLAGAGNNGGDGFVVARHLRLRGIPTDVYLLADRESVRGDARTNLDLLEKLGERAKESAPRSEEELATAWKDYTLLVDALGGTGITGALRGDLAKAVSAANATGVPILAIDIPTGLNCDTGQVEGPAIRASGTITFVARKAGFDQPGAREYTGEVVVADIGVPVDLFPGGEGHS
jgi:NAD(P)H-hydrate epimerase